VNRRSDPTRGSSRTSPTCNAASEHSKPGHRQKQHRYATAGGELRHAVDDAFEHPHRRGGDEDRRQVGGRDGARVGIEEGEEVGRRQVGRLGARIELEFERDHHAVAGVDEAIGLRQE